LQYLISTVKLEDVKLTANLKKEVEKEKPDYLVTLITIYDKAEYADVEPSSLKKLVNALFPKKTKKDKEKDKQDKNKKK